MPPPPPPPPGPPELPAASSGHIFRVFAQASWASVIVSFFINVALAGSAGHPQSRAEALGRGLASAFIAITGLVCGIIALCGIRKYGRKGLLLPALTGIGLWLLLFIIAIPTFLFARHQAQLRHAGLSQKVELTPLVHIPGASRVEETSLGLSFDLPPGFSAIPSEKLTKEYRLGFVKQDNASLFLILVKSLGGTIVPGEHLPARFLPQGKNLTMKPSLWRGLGVDRIRVPEKMPNGDFVTFNVQIPLKKQAIQIGFGAPAANETALGALADQVIPTIDGPVNW